MNTFTGYDQSAFDYQRRLYEASLRQQQGLAGGLGLGGLLGQSDVATLSNRSVEQGLYREEPEPRTINRKKTIREELQSELDDWLKDVV